jgi:hypothetical protein
MYKKANLSLYLIKHAMKMHHVRWVPCHHGMERPQVADGDALQLWRAAVNILNNKLRTAEKGWSFSLEGWAWG